MNSIKWNEGHVTILDQRKLPLHEVYTDYSNYRGVASSIREMEIRGAPAIGIAAGMGIALAGKNSESKSIESFREEMYEIIELFKNTRPTAVNLFWAAERMKKIIDMSDNVSGAVEKLEAEALSIHREDIEMNKKIGQNGSRFLEDGDVVMTHCNAGALATGGYGTALGVIRAAIEEGKKIEVYACETRPYLQGARLTAWELKKDNIPVTLITDNMSGYFMKKGVIKKIVVGADRIALNGDTANKIGTYTHSVLAKNHNIPFYVAAPTSTLDPDTKSGEGIPIEERNIEEVVYIQSEQIAPEGISVKNPAFDVTPADFITALITERGVEENPAEKGISALLEREN
jgi:methylthioribose-1-phosphate isomerase